jgi:MoaA/NifB/PqqE/SkfB family radical SAM enzyme
VTDKKQLSYAADRVWNEIQASHEFPLSVLFCLTERCCMSCPHCYIDRKKIVQELSLDEILLIFDELAELGVLSLSITGGEPGLRNDLIAIIKAAAERHFAISLKTSAYPFDTPDIDLLWEAGLSRLNVSLYHTNPDEHDRFVGRSGAWKKTVNALERFSKRSGRCYVSCPVMQWNALDISNLMDFCERRGWNPNIDAKITHRDDGSCEPCSLAVTENKMLGILEDERITAPASSDHDPSKPPCNAGISSAYITPDGSVRACPSIPWIFGNLRESSFSEIWQNSTARKSVLALTWNDSPLCRDCSHARYCNRCPGESILEHGDPTKPATVDCFLANARHRHAEEKGEKLPE